MQITIRSERATDIRHIARVNHNAFLGWHPDNPYVSEPIIVDSLRHGSGFDPDLSLVAESEGEVIGHALFYPFKVIVTGTEQKGVVLGPIAVLPERQKTGIGSQLMEEGHRRALEKGFSFSLLCGHSSYYPRFGYRTKMFSLTGVKRPLAGFELGPVTLTERPVFENDVNWLCAMWNTFYNKAALALCPGHAVCDWINHSPLYKASVLMAGDTPVGYARYPVSQPGMVREIIAMDARSFQAILAFLAAKASERGAEWLSLPMSLADVRQAAPGVESGFESALFAHDAFMIKILDKGNDVVSEYCEDVGSGKLAPGTVIFPVFYDVDDGVTH